MSGKSMLISSFHT